MTASSQSFGLDDMSLVWPAAVQLLFILFLFVYLFVCFFNSGSQWVQN